MQAREVLDRLEDLADKLGIEIVYERLSQEDFRASGGLCKVKGMHKIFVDPSETVEGRIRILAEALSGFDTEKIYLLPQIRQILDKARKAS